MQQKAPGDFYLRNDTFLDIKRKNTFIISLFPDFCLIFAAIILYQSYKQK